MSFFESNDFKRISKNVSEKVRKEWLEEMDRQERRRKFWDKVLTAIILIASLTVIHFVSRQT